MEEVSERTDESESTSQNYSYNSAGDLNSSISSLNDDSSETMLRIKMAEDIKEIEKMSKEVFATAPIPFNFDFEDYENCKLNGEIRKIINLMKITVPIIHIKGTS